MKPIVALRTITTKRFAVTLIVALCAFFFSCKKTGDPHTPHDPPPPPPPPGTKVGLLKDINVERLPSPYYHFDYTDEGVTTAISFASGFFNYTLSYVNGRLEKMVNGPIVQTLLYEYNNSGRVTSIRVQRPDNTYLSHYTIDYNNNNQVKEIRYYVSAKSSGGDSIFYKKVLFAYYQDGNLEHYEKYVDITGQQLVRAETVTYSEYDNGKNVDGFRHYKDFFDHVIYLPGVQFQKNNPRKQIIIGQDVDYEVTDIYTYQDGKPVSKQSHFRQTRGTNVGQETNGGTTFSYY